MNEDDVFNELLRACEETIKHFRSKTNYPDQYLAYRMAIEAVRNVRLVVPDPREE
jgi:hypothetical protein